MSAPTYVVKVGLVGDFYPYLTENNGCARTSRQRGAKRFTCRACVRRLVRQLRKHPGDRSLARVVRLAPRKRGAK